jgi:excisionase family DNA binding protein
LAFLSDTLTGFADASPCPLVPTSRTGEGNMERLAYSINDTAKALSLGRTSIYAMIADGRLEALKLGRRTLIKADSIRRVVEGKA